jgi:hypothetical protein
MLGVLAYKNHINDMIGIMEEDATFLSLNWWRAGKT